MFWKKTALILTALMLALSFTACFGKVVVEGNEGSHTVSYNRKTYIADAFYCADADRHFLGKADSGADVYSIGSYEPPEYILIEGYDNSDCFIAEGSKVPTSGVVTKALIDPSIRGNNSKYLSTADELSMLEELSKTTGELQKFLVDNYYTDGNAFYYVYDNSDVSCSDNFGGYIAYTDGKWIFASPKTAEFEWGENNAMTVTAVVIEDKKLIDKMCGTDLTKYIEYDSPNK